MQQFFRSSLKHSRSIIKHSLWSTIHAHVQLKPDGRRLSLLCFLFCACHVSTSYTLRGYMAVTLLIGAVGRIISWAEGNGDTMLCKVMKMR